MQVQLNLSALGLPTIPDPAQLAEVDTAALATAFTSRQLTLWGVSATYNMAHPDQATRRATTDRAARFIARLGPLGPVAATLCTGTRDPASMWRPHADNDTVGAWADFRASLETLLPAAADAKVLLAVEPEPGNVVSGTAQAQRLAKELGSDAEQIGFILDPANLVSHLPSDQHEHVLTEAFDVLGDRTICLHAKDIQSWADTLGGRIGVDYRLVSRLYRELRDPSRSSSRTPPRTSSLWCATGCFGTSLPRDEPPELRRRSGLRTGQSPWRPTSPPAPRTGGRQTTIHSTSRPVERSTSHRARSRSPGTRRYPRHGGQERLRTGRLGRRCPGPGCPPRPVRQAHLHRWHLHGRRMGAAIALRLAVRRLPDLRGAAFVRPAFSDVVAPANLRPLQLIGTLLSDGDAGRQAFLESTEYRSVAAASPAGGSSLLDQFSKPAAAERAGRLLHVPGHPAWRDQAELDVIDMATVILGADRDPVHPLELARRWSDVIPGATFHQLPDRDDDRVRHDNDARSVVRAHITSTFDRPSTRAAT